MKTFVVKGDVMTSATFVLLSGALTFGVPLYIAVRELRTLGPNGGWRPDHRDPDPVPPPPDKPVIMTPPKPLPDCLIPKPLVAARAPADRALELV